MTRQTPFDTTLRCVALPIVKSDIGQPLNELLALWSDPRFAPVLEDVTHRPQLLIVVNDADEGMLSEAGAIRDAHPALARSFGGCTIRSADLKDDMDRYERKPRGRIGRFGARAGPNFQFFRTMEMAEEFGGFTLQVELDCLPVQAGWIEATQKVIDRHAGAWVIGSVYAGSGELKRESQSHVNGNALYRTGDAVFQSFLAEVWMPRLLKHIKVDYTLPYDCWWALERSEASALRANESWHLFQTFDGYMHSDPFIVNLLCKTSDLHQYLDVFHKFSDLGQTPVFFHGAPMAALRPVLLDNPSDSIQDSMDRLTPSASRPLRSMRFARQSHLAPERSLPDWLETLPPGETLLRTAAARLLVEDEPSGLTRAAKIVKARALLGEDAPTVRFFDRVAAVSDKRHRALADQQIDKS